MNFKYIIKGLGGIALCLIFSKESQATLNFSIIDSIGVENVNNKQIVLHRLEAKESYYSLSRKYAVQPKDISSYNNNKALKIGDVIKIPTNRPFSNTAPSRANTSSNSTPPAAASANPTIQANNPNNEQNTQYRVSAGETLYNIARRFQVSVNQIVQVNNLKNEQDIKAGQTITIPQESQNPRVVEPVEEPIITEVAEERRNPLPANRYGLKQVNQNGVGVWMEGLNSDGGNMLALHKTAPVGTVVKITNPMTQKTTFAKIVGKYNDNNNTRDAVIVISKATANLLGILDKRFLINISYGMPN